METGLVSVRLTGAIGLRAHSRGIKIAPVRNEVLQTLKTHKRNWSSRILFASAMLALISGACVTHTNSGKVSPPPVLVKKTFVKDATLTDSELKQVVALAKQCGIPDVDRVETFHYLPTILLGIAARSKERVNGRNIFYDTVILGREGWPPGIRVDAKAKRLGAFWVNRPYISTRQLREFGISNQTVRVMIGSGVAVSFADKAIPLVLAGILRFEDGSHSDFQRGDLSKPTSLLRNDSNYVLSYEEPRRIAVSFKLEKDTVVITSISEIDI